MCNSKSNSKTKLTLLVLALIIVPVLSSCGEEDIASTYTSSTTGQTDPGGYYFNLTIRPSVVQKGGTLFLSAHVWDSNGNNASGVSVSFSGDVKIGTTVPTTNGYAGVYLIMKTGTRTTGSITVGNVTATVENLSVDAPYQIVP